MGASITGLGLLCQLLTIVVPSLAEMSKEGGEAGRAQINQYTRYITIPLAALQAFGTIRLLQNQGGAGMFRRLYPVSMVYYSFERDILRNHVDYVDRGDYFLNTILATAFR